MHSLAILASLLVASASAAPSFARVRRQTSNNITTTGTTDISCSARGAGGSSIVQSFADIAGAPAALLITPNGFPDGSALYACGCSADVADEKSGVQVTLCQGTDPYRMGTPSASNCSSMDAGCADLARSNERVFCRSRRSLGFVQRRLPPWVSAEPAERSMRAGQRRQLKLVVADL